MINVVFAPWRVDGSLAIISWKVYPTTGLAQVDRVDYRVWRDDSTPVVVTTTDLTKEVSIDVTNFNGDLFAEVVAYDAVGNTKTELTELSVNNHVPPTPPDWLTYDAFGSSSLTLRWGASFVSNTTVSWKVYHRQASGTTPLAIVPVSQLSAFIAIDLTTVDDLYVVGVDADGHESAPSPVLDLTPQLAGPVIEFTSWTMGVVKATIAFSISGPRPIAAVSWVAKRAGVVVGEGLTAGTVNIDVVDFEGPVELSVTAVDDQNVSRTAVVHARVWNRIPRRPVIEAQAVGTTYIRLEAGKDFDDPATVAYVEVTGLGLTVRQPAPFVYTFMALQPDTEYTFTARAINPGGFAGADSQPFTVRTFEDVSATEPVPGALVPGPVLAQILPWMTGDLLEYLLQASADTRVRDVASKQIVRTPDAFDPFLAMVAPIAASLGKTIRDETSDSASMEASWLIDKTPDTLGKLVVLAERVAFGSILNKG